MAREVVEVGQDPGAGGRVMLLIGASAAARRLAAEVMAANLGVALYRVDLSAVVSEYIGETEKNLRRVFDAAERGGPLLFFDEADALFGMRSDVKDAHDRYANDEVNYFLACIGHYAGVGIVSVNKSSDASGAWLHWFRWVVDFSLHDS
jgi:SpoVK/Ycf46/Vps4 family AAA+-type ATPase